MKGADLIKFCLSLVVVWIHTGTNDLFGLATLAVPAFFILSGFFLWNKLFATEDSGERRRILSRWLKRILRLYLIWTLIYLPFAVIGIVQDGLPFYKGILVWLRNVVLVGENYLSWPLWYLLGLLWAGLILYLSNKLSLPFWGVCVLGIVMASLPFLLKLESRPLYLSLFKTTRNGLFVGFPLMMLGGLLRALFPSLKGWNAGTWQQRTGLALRFQSIHIYLTHMLWAGGLILFFHSSKGLFLWGAAVFLSLLTGLIIAYLPAVQRGLYGRVYVGEK